MHVDNIYYYLASNYMCIASIYSVISKCAQICMHETSVKLLYECRLLYNLQVKLHVNACTSCREVEIEDELAVPFHPMCLLAQRTTPVVFI